METITILLTHIRMVLQAVPALATKAKVTRKTAKMILEPEMLPMLRLPLSIHLNVQLNRHPVNPKLQQNATTFSAFANLAAESTLTQC